MNYSELSNSALSTRKNMLVKEIRDYEDSLKNIHSTLYVMSINHCIKVRKKQIHLIDAELRYRDAFNK